MSKRKHLRFLAVGMAVFLLSGCGDSASGSSSKYEGYAAADNSYADAEGYAEDASYADDAAYADDAGGYDLNASDTEAGADASGTLSRDKIVYTASVSLETLTYADAYEALKTRINDADGIIESESVSNSNYYWYREDSADLHYLSMTVRIPSAAYADFVDAMDEIGKVQSKSQNAENISTRYHNTEALIRGLETQEERLLEMMKEAEYIEDMISVEDRLSEVQIELDQARTYLSSMDTDIAYSTVNIYLEEVVEYTESDSARKTNSFADRFKNAVSDSWSFFLELLEGLLFLFIYLLPILIVVLIIILIVRRILRKTKGKRAAKQKKSYFPGRKPKDSETQTAGEAGSTAEPTAPGAETATEKEELPSEKENRYR